MYVIVIATLQMIIVIQIDSARQAKVQEKWIAILMNPSLRHGCQFINIVINSIFIVVIKNSTSNLFATLVFSNRLMLLFWC